MSKLNIAAAVAAITLVTGAAVAAPYGPDKILNGGFETNTLGGTSAQMTTTNVANWTINPTPGYTFVYSPSATNVSKTQADSPGGLGQYGAVSLYGPANGNNNGLTTCSPAAACGGTFIATDGAFQLAKVQQTVSGLSIGTDYLLTFYQAAAQQTGFTGATTDQWSVTFGNSPATLSSLMSIGTAGFAAWNRVTMTFRATGTSQLLSFNAIGTPSSSQPPFALLDGVSLFAVPEPATWALMLGSVVGISALVRRRGGSASAA